MDFNDTRVHVCVAYDPDSTVWYKCMKRTGEGDCDACVAHRADEITAVIKKPSKEDVDSYYDQCQG